MAVDSGKEDWSERGDSNPRPSGPKPDALPLRNSPAWGFAWGSILAQALRPRNRAARAREAGGYFFPEERRAEDHWGSSTVPEARMAKILENGVVSQ